MTDDEKGVEAGTPNGERDPKQTDSAKLLCVLASSKAHLELIRRGFRTHHLDGRVVYMVKP